MVRTIIVDDHEVVRAGLVAALADYPRVKVVGAAGNGDEAVRLVRARKPTVALVDWMLPDIGGEELCRALVEAEPELRVVVLTTYLREETVRSAVQAGASAYVTKTAGLAHLKKVIAEVAAGPPSTPNQTPASIARTLHDLVSDRMAAGMPTPHQTRVLELAAEGLTNRQIGERLFISESTVRFHMQKLKRTFDARTRTELIAKAIRAGVVGPGPQDEG
jgi:DNA-binding NarL/FixJ family response regulator